MIESPNLQSVVTAQLAYAGHRWSQVGETRKSYSQHKVRAPKMSLPEHVLIRSDRYWQRVVLDGVWLLFVPVVLALAWLLTTARRLLRDRRNWS